VGGEAGAKHGLNLVLQDHAGLVTAQVGHGCKTEQQTANEERVRG
jgi:hypothetical protein